MPWVVAKFHSQRDDGLSLNTIPSSWITIVGRKKYALYPPVHVSGSELKRLVYKGENPKGDWDLLHLKYISPCFDSIIEALDYECKAVALSGTDLEVLEKAHIVGKRKRKAKNIRYPNEPVSSEEEGAKETVDPLSISESEIKSKAETVIGHSRASKPVSGTEPGSTVKLLFTTGKSVKLMQNRVLKPREIIPVLEANEIQASRQTNTDSLENSDNDYDSVKDLLGKIEQKMKCQTKFIVKEIRSMKETIANLSSKVKNMNERVVSDEDFSEIEHIIPLPVDSFEDLMCLHNEIISSPKYRRYMLKILKDHALGLDYDGIPSLNRTVYSILSTMMTSNIARMLNMTGIAKNKVPFQLNFPKLTYLIYDVVKAKKMSGPDVDMSLLKRCIGEWLRQARNRSNGEKMLTQYYEVDERLDCLEENDEIIA